MIGYITLGSNDLSRSGAFYDALLTHFGAQRAYTLDAMIAYSFGPQKPMLVVTMPNDGAAAKAGNGTMVALMAADKAQVDAVHATALALGAADEGAPSEHAGQHYGGYFRDPDGNKLSGFVMV